MRRSLIIPSVLLLVLVAGCSATRTAVVQPPAVQPPAAEAPEAAFTAMAQEDGRATQCAAGGTGACLSLCQDEAKCDDKDDCNEVANSIPPCSDGITPGSLCTLPASEIAPTQGAVGMFAVDCKAKKIDDKNTSSGNKLKRYLLERQVPAVLGLDGRLYITDRHHLSTAVFRSSIQDDRKNLYMCPMVEKTGATPDEFWAYMEANHFVWPRNNRGQRIPPSQLPTGLQGLADDPYRTLSRWTRDSCGYIKCGTVCGEDGENTDDLFSCKACSETPFFLEFKWADYYRSQVPISGIYDLHGEPQAAVLRQHLNQAMTESASSKAANEGLPGWNAGLIQTKLIQFGPDGCED